MDNEDQIVAVLTKLLGDGPFVLHNEKVCRKDALSDVYDVPDDVFFALISGRYITIDRQHLHVTPCGYKLAEDAGHARGRSAKYRNKMIRKGRIRKSVWVHPDDIVKFNNFILTLKGPSDE